MAASTERTQPSTLVALGRALRRRCPICGDRSISRHPAHVEPRCPRCGLDLERQVGSFIGGVAVNTVVASVALLAVIVVGFIATDGEASVTKILLPALVLAVVVPTVFYARSRLGWVALELKWWPLTADELDRAQQSDLNDETRSS